MENKHEFERCKYRLDWHNLGSYGCNNFERAKENKIDISNCGEDCPYYIEEKITATTISEAGTK